MDDPTPEQALMAVSASWDQMLAVMRQSLKLLVSYHATAIDAGLTQPVADALTLMIATSFGHLFIPGARP